jgi:RHS repeat-associated protein
MNYWDGQQWVPSDPSFEVIEDAFVATRLQHKVHLDANLNKVGAVTVTTGDGITLRSTPVGIGLYDAASGRSAVIAEVRDCAGLLVSSNQVLYENAFNGVCADVIYTIDRGSFEQDILITGRLDPADHGFPIDTTRLQILTEFYETPQPDRIRRPIRIEQRQAIRERMAKPDFEDEVLGFGEFVLATGRASLGPSTSETAAAVAKEFTTIRGRTFLIESVESVSVLAQLKLLPSCRSETAWVPKMPDASKAGYAVLPEPRLVERAKVAADRSATQTAKVVVNKRAGVVIDYIATIGGTLSGATVFQGDTTYFVAGPVYCNGSTTIEGGAVFKYPNSTGANPTTAYIKLNNSLVCKTSSYRPAIFTAADDDTIGETVTVQTWASHSGNPQGKSYANPALWIYNINSTLGNVRFIHAQEGIRVEGGSANSSIISHAQLVNCIRGIVLTGDGGGSGLGVTINNSLMARVQYPITINTAADGNFYNCTFDQSTQVVSFSGTNGSIAMVNSVFANVSTLAPYLYYDDGFTFFNLYGNHNGFFNSPQFGGAPFVSPASPFQSQGAGNYYLAAGSNFRNAGTTTVGSALLGELRKKTTYPPIALSGTIPIDTTLSPQAQRDTDTPDLGYHYDPLDWAVNGMGVDYAALTLVNGVALSVYGDSGLVLRDGARLVSEGTPLNRNHISCYNTVQEQPIILAGGSVNNNISVDPSNTGTALPVFDCRFTDFDGTSGGGHHLFLEAFGRTLGSVILRDCQFHSGWASFGGPKNATLLLNNNLFDRVGSTFLFYPSLSCYNNLFKGGLVYFERYSGSDTWTIKDNCFDNCQIQDWSGSSLSHGYNAYINSSARLSPNSSDDKTLTSLTYLNGALGGYYQPNTSPLRNAGSRTADLAGLYHYTTTTNQVREAATQVDIGYHYVATNCGPVDTVWVDDAVPAGATQIDETGLVAPWTWTTGNPGAFSGAQAHQSVSATGLHQHYFYDAMTLFAVNSGDTLVAYIYMDAANAPTEIMLQWRASGSWEHRAYWGANNIFPGVESPANKYLGALPAAGQWVRLEVTASLVGLEGTALDGMAFTLYGGRATWDYAGKQGGNFCYDTDADGVPDYKQQNPVITLSGALSYTEDQPAVLIDATATVTDLDSPMMAGGSLMVEIVAPAQGVDLLGIQNQGTGPGQIGISGSTVSYGGITIGTFSGGSGAPLRVNLVGNPAVVTLAAVQAMARNLTYRNTSQNFSPTTPRPLRISIEDGRGGYGAAIKNLTIVSVNDAPTLSSITVLPGGLKNTPFTITYEALVAAANEADVDSSEVHFRVEAVSSGSLQKSGAPVVPGATLLSPGQSLVWTPAAGVYGGGINAFTVKAYDGALTSSSPVQVSVSVANVNSPPVIGLPTTPTPEFLKGGASILIDPAATVTDPDSVTFDAAVLTVAVSGFATADDRLAIRNQGTGAGQIGVSGNSVTYNGVNIGSFSGGAGFLPLLVQYNAAATLTSVQALLRNLTYQNVLLAAQPGARAVRLVLTDGDGGTSPPATKTINVVCPGIDVMLVLDRSRSMRDPVSAPVIEVAKAAAKQFASYLDFTKDQCGIVSFAESASSPIDLTLGNNLANINSRIDAIEALGSTCIDCGIDAATTELTSARHRVGNLRVMVILTDGLNNAGPPPLLASAAAAKNSPNHVRLITIGLGVGVDKDTLISAASSPDDFYDAPTSDQLAGKFAEIAATLCRLAFSRPALSAGPDKVVHLPGTATLDGSVTDDGNTGNGIFNLIWSVASVGGFGSVVFDNASAAQTTATFSAPGEYVLRLTGSNPHFSGSDDMVVSVYEDTGENQAPQVRAYPVERVLIGGSTMLRGSILDDGLPAGSNVTKSWGQVAGAGGGPVQVNPASPSQLETIVGPFTQSGRYLYRLTASDGQLSASDEVMVTVCNGDAGPVDVVLIMDNSSSMGTGGQEDPNGIPRFVRARTAAKTFLDFINPAADQVALVQFSSVATLASELTADIEVVRTAIAHMGRVQGSTDIASTLYAALAELISTRHRPESTSVVILLSDGYPDDSIAAMAAANQLKNAGVRFVTIALVPADQTAARDFLRTISSSADDAYAGVTTAELSRIYASIAESFCLGQNRRPLVGIEGPPELLINRGDALTLRGTAMDDGVPGGALTFRWTQSGVYDGCDHRFAIGGGTATFAASAAQETAVSFSGPGYYVLRFSAHDVDPDSGSYAEVGVLVNDVPSVTAGASQTFGWTGSEIVAPLAGTASSDTVSGPSFYDISSMTWQCPGLGIRWSLVSGLSTASIENADSFDMAVAHLTGPGRYVVRLSVDDGFAAASADVALTVLPENSVDAGADKTGSSGVSVSLADAATNPNTTTLGWSKQEGPGVANPTFSNPNVLRPTVTFPASGSYILRLTANFGAATLYDELTVRVGTAGVQAGPDITIKQGGTAMLSGTAINVSGTDLAAQWFVISAPSGGQVTFANASSKSTTATFNLPGTYQLRLKASSGADDLLVFVNQPPIVDAGSDQTVVKEKPAELTGSIVGDDLLPPNALPIITWSKLDGPGTVTFQSVNSLKTFARFSVEGVYVLKLAVSDSHLSGDDTMTVKVVTPPVARNDVFQLEEGKEPFILDVLRNDTDREGDPLTILSYDTDLGRDANGQTIRTAGTLELINNHTQFLFIPDPGARYTWFFYRIADRHGGVSGYATVTIQIVPPPHAPKAKSDVLYTSTAAVDEWIPILDNDDDGGYGPLSIISYTPLKEINGGPGYGTLSLRAERILPDPGLPLMSQQLMFTADPAHAGIYTFTYTVRNQKSATATGAVVLVVEPAYDPNSAPIVDAGEDQEIYINQPLILAGTIDNDPGDWIQSVVWSCASPNVIFDNTADPASAVSFTTPGDYTLRLTATDGGGSAAFDEVFVRVLSEGRPPVAEIFNLANDSNQRKPDPVVTEGQFELRGRATDPNPANAITYRIGLYHPTTIAGNQHAFESWLTPNGDAQGKRTLPGLQRITGEAGDDLLGQLDFTRFPNGVHILTLEVWGGNVTAPSTTEVRFALNTELRLGRLTFAEEDLAITASGFPMRLIRSYDSMAGDGPDFGWGWKYELKDLDLQLDEERSEQDFIDDDTGFLTSANVRYGGGRNVTLTLPDGRRVTYRFGLRVSITTGYAYAEYTPPPGVQPDLLPKGDTRLVYLVPALSGNKIEPFWQESGTRTPMHMYDFPGFILRMGDGTEYHLDAPPLFQDGIHLPDDTFINPRGPLHLSQIVRPNGEKMVHTHNWPADDAVETYDAQGHRRQALALIRDGAGRITKVVDALSTAAQPTVEYIYDTSGRLKNVRRLADRSANRYDVTTYFYENATYPYRITRIEDPRQVTRTQFVYFPDGKLERIIQPGGVETIFQHDLAGMKETITDPVRTQTVHSFDPAGRITETEIKDTLGNRLSKVIRSFDPATTFLTSESVFLRRIGQSDFYADTYFEYDPDGNVSKVTDPNSFSSSFTHNRFGQVVSATDPREKTLLNNYDSSGNLIDSTDAEDGNTHNTYVNNRLESSTSPADALTTYSYYGGETGGAVGDLKAVTVTEWDPASDQNVTLSRTTYTYDANSNVQTERQERKTGTASWSPVQALVTSYTYDAQNRAIQTRIQADPPDPQIDSTSSMTYNSIGKVETSTDRLGRVTSYNYDARGNLVQTVFPGSTVYPAVPVTITRTVYDEAGRACYIQDQHDRPASGNSSMASGRHVIYDGLGRVVRTEQLANLTIELTSSGSPPNLIYATRVLMPDTTPSAPAPQILAASETRYDAGGRAYATAEKRLHPSGDPNLEEDRSLTTHAYDDAGRRIATYVALDDESGTIWDGRLVAQYGYDQAGNLTSVTDALHSETEPRVTEYEYDAVNRRTLSRFPQIGTEPTRATRSVEYDKAGRRVAETDELNRTTRFKYDGLGRLCEVTDPDLRVTTYKYDWVGNLLEQTDALNHSTTYRYDALGRRVRRTLPGEQFEAFTYDAEGNRLTQTDFEQKTTTFTYDVLRRLRKITPDASFVGETPVQFEYFANGRRRQLIDASGQTDYEYDAIGRLKLKTTPRGRINYAYNETSGRRTMTMTTANQNGSSRTGLGGSSITYKWNSLNQLVSATDGTATTTYGYDAVGNLENIDYPIPADGSRTHYIYDTRNRLKEMTVGSSSLARYLYDVAANGRRTRVTESGMAVNTPATRTVDYAYDNLDRLTRELIAGDEGAKNGELAYRHDDVGNRTWSKADPFGNPGTTSTFDANDRLGTAANYDKNGNTLVSGTSNYQYDFLNRIKRRTGGAEVVYDGDANLASRTLGGITTYYLVDDQNPTGHAQVLEELSADQSQVRKRYMWGLQLINQVDDTLPAGDQVSYSGLDGHGNVRFLLKADGTARADRYVYDAFGRMIRSVVTTPNFYLYCGERWDSDLGLYYLRARYLNPGTGRFMSMDTFEGTQADPLSLHKYLYAHADAVNGVDPTGHETQASQLGTVGGLSYLATRIASVGSQAFFRVANLVARVLINQEKILLYTESTAALLTAGTVVGTYAVEAAADVIEKASASWLNNTRPVPGEWSARGFAIEAVAGEHLGEAYIGGNVEKIDIFSNKGATIAGSIKSHALDASLPDYEGRLLREIGKDANALKGIEDISLGGTTRTGQAFLKPPGTIDTKVLLVAIPEDQALVMNSRTFMQRVREIAIQTRSVIVTAPVRGWKAR